jgi:O-methyltransferase
MQKLLLRAAPLFAERAFFLQGQMDIHPKSRWHRTDFVARNGGFFLKDDPVERRIASFDSYDLVRRDMLVLLCRSLLTRDVAGDFAELGVYKGMTARLLHYYAPDRMLHLFDTFAGFDERDVAAERSATGLAATTQQFSDTDLDAVRRYVAPLNDNVRFYAGFFPATATTDVQTRTFALVHLDADLYEPILAGLQFFYPRVRNGGFIVVHDYNAWAGSRQAVEEFMADKPEVVVPMPDKSGSALIVKQ